jgi:hypothetical protein
MGRTRGTSQAICARSIASAYSANDFGGERKDSNPRYGFRRIPHVCGALSHSATSPRLSRRARVLLRGSCGDANCARITGGGCSANRLAATAVPSHIANMAEPNLSKWECTNCGAKLLLKRRTEPKRRREEALCPNCMVNLPPRDGKDTLQYALVELPKTPKRPRDFS